MSYFLKPCGVFDINDSDRMVGSYFKREDLKDILNIDEETLNFFNFEDNIFGTDLIDEYKIHITMKKVNCYALKYAA